MPNYVKNRIHMTGEKKEIDRLLEAVKIDEKPLGTVDFNKIIPMPESLNMESGSLETCYMEAYLTAINPLMSDYGVQKMEEARFGELLQKANASKSFHRFCCDLDEKTMSEYLKMKGETDENFIALGGKYFDNLQKYGATSWYDFCVENWGSKWNAMNTELIDESTLGFETAWSRVMPIMSKLAEMFPEIDFEYSWADEDIGNNVGECEFQQGKLTYENVMNSGSTEAVELAASMWDGVPEDFGFNFNDKTGAYEYDCSPEMNF